MQKQTIPLRVLNGPAAPPAGRSPEVLEHWST